MKFSYCLTGLLTACQVTAGAVVRRAELLPIDARLAARQASSSTSTATTTQVADSQCTNGPHTRQCWGNGFSIASDYDVSWPNTGKTVSYTLELTNTTIAPDGVPHVGYVLNGQFPGPTLRASWGDTLSITVKNSLQTNGTSIHWHGIRQWHTNHMDGTNGVTECPLAPGQSRTYTFLCTQFGTTWYHSHYSDQYTDGTLGTIIIDGPTTANWDYDLGTMTVQDWYYEDAFTIAPLLESGALARGPPPANNVLINGSQVNTNGGGQYHRNTITKGSKYLLRIVNTATNDGYKVSLDGHPFQVVAADFVPIKPFFTTWLYIGIGQRYTVVINANQTVDSYWFHAVPQAPCSNNLNSNALSIFSYTGANNTTPPQGATNLPPTTDCNDPNSQLIPYWKSSVPADTIIPTSSNLGVGLAITQNSQGSTQVNWVLNLTAIVAEWDKPTLQYVLDGNTSYPQSMNVLELPVDNVASVWVIQEVAAAAPPIPHPIHLHGHDFYVLGTGSGVYSDASTLNYNNPPRRDVAMLPGGGWLVIAFITDNPGAWLLHCHIAWHVGLGLGAQYMEQRDKIVQTLNIGPDWKDECATWDAYYQNAIYKETDSGL